MKKGAKVWIFVDLGSESERRRGFEGKRRDEEERGKRKARMKMTRVR